MGRHQLFKKKRGALLLLLLLVSKKNVRRKSIKIVSKKKTHTRKKCLLFSKLFSQQALTKREFRVFENISKNFLSRCEGKAFEKEKEKKMSKKKKKRKKREKQGEKVPSFSPLCLHFYPAPPNFSLLLRSLFSE